MRLVVTFLVAAALALFVLQFVTAKLPALNVMWGKIQ